MLINENDPRLKQTCDHYDFELNSELTRLDLMKRMTDVMLGNNGIGLAAPQIGEMVNVFVILINNLPVFCFNPKIVQQSNETTVDYEGCLSFPDLWLKVLRSDIVTLRYHNSDGDVVSQQFDGILARCVLHEYDHLQGVCFVEKVGPVKLAMAKTRRFKKKKAQ